VSQFGKFLAKLLIVLDNAIVDYSYSATTIGMRMGIELRNTPMGCPAGVPDGDVAGQACQVMLLNDLVDLADILLY
jgi:hypothetical protein